MSKVGCRVCAVVFGMEVGGCESHGHQVDQALQDGIDSMALPFSILKGFFGRYTRMPASFDKESGRFRLVSTSLATHRNV